MTDTLGAVLVVEIGSLLTRVTLIDKVDGESRLVGHAETSSSTEAPFQNALYAVLEAAAQLSELTGRQLIREGQLIMPQSSERDGVNQLVAVTSAAGTLALVVAAIASDVSARSAIHACRSTYTALLQTVTLDDAASPDSSNGNESSWIERQVERLLTLRPDAVLIAGGLEHGAVDAVNRLAHIVGLTAMNPTVDASGQQRQQITARPVIYAGNSGAREQVIAALSDRAELFVVDNLRPALDQANLDPARQEFGRLYERLVLPRLPGLAALKRMGRTPVRTVCEAEGLVTRFLAERTGRRLLAVDVGASATSAFHAAPGSYQVAVLGTTGVSYGLTELLATVGVGAIARWLPFSVDEQRLGEQLLNRLLRPHTLPSTREELYIEHAVAREALRAAYAALREQGPDGAFAYDWLVAGGGVLAHAPQPGLALLTLLDALEPSGDGEHAVLDLYLDSLSLMPVGGALAFLDPDAAVTVIDRDLLRNTPLASVVVPRGEGRSGDVAVEVELSIVGGTTERRVVHHGELVRLPLNPGRFGQLTIKPAADVRIGGAGPGESVATEGGDIAGSALGVVIDARGKSLQLSQSAQQRRARLWSWLVALGVERGDSPYHEPEPHVPVAPPAEPPVREASTSEQPASTPALADLKANDALPHGRRVSLDELVGAEAEPEQPTELDSDLDALRRTVEEPKRGGLFRWKK